MTSAAGTSDFMEASLIVAGSIAAGSVAGNRPRETMARPCRGSGRFGVKHPAHRHGELLIGERLLNEIDTGIETALMHDGVARISGHEQHLQSRMPLPRLLGELA